MATRKPSRRAPVALLRAAALYLVALVSIAQPARAAESAAAPPAAAARLPSTVAATGFVASPETIEPPYTNEKCLDKCHGLADYYAGGADGSLRLLTVEPQAYVFSTHGQKGVQCIDCHQGADPNTHPRVGYPDVDCRACHSKNSPEGVFPENALAQLAERGIKAPPEEARVAESWDTTVHGKAWAQGRPTAPFCPDCHTAHAIVNAADPASTVHVDQLPATCGRCHADQVVGADVGGVLARLRIGAHGKGDLSQVHAVSRCVSCHQGEAVHGEESVTGQACPSCHRVPAAEAGAEKSPTTLSSLHIKPFSDTQPVAQVLGWVYRVGAWSAAAGAVVMVVVVGFAHLLRSEEEG